MIEPIQIIIAVITLFALSRVFLRYRDKEISVSELLLWSIVWISVLIVSLLPRWTTWVSDLSGVGRPADALVYISIVILFYLVFKIYVKIDNIRKDVTQLTREISIFEAEKERKE